MTTKKQIIEAIADQTNFEIEQIVKGPVIAKQQKWSFEVKGESQTIVLFADSLSAFDVEVWVDAICDAYDFQQKQVVTV